jgi:phospholipid/cholesterol/gamma-HCH transport system substrate-binding protein
MRRLVSIALVAAISALALVVVLGAGQPAGGTYLVRAIFDDAAYAVQGEDVRVAGANVGTIQSLGVTRARRAAVTLEITDPRFAPFHADASCTIRPQSLIGEEYVDCNPGTPSAPALPVIRTGAGSGSHLLPVTQTSSPISPDIVQDISTQPVRQSLALIIDEFGTGLAARGSDLNAVIHRANPALGNTERVVRILASQNRLLARLATDSDAVLTPLAQERSQLAGFITSANRTASASAQQTAAISATFRLFPAYLQQLQPLMADLGALAGQGTPLLTSLGTSAGSLGREFANLTPFAQRARTALIELGSAAQRSQSALVASVPLARRLRAVGLAGAPTSAELARLTASLQSTGGIQQLMALLFNGASAGNGFDSLGHYVRDEPLVSSCTQYVQSAVPGCSADFAAVSGGATSASAASASASAASASAASAASASASATARPDAVVATAVRRASATSDPAQLRGLMNYLLHNGQ